MMNRPDRFNTYLLLAMLAAGVCACQTKAEKEKKKEPPKPYSTVYVHLESKGPVTDRSQAVPIYRAHPVTIYTEKQAFLDGRDYCLPDDFKQLAVSVFSHRVVASSRHASLQKKSEATESVLRDIVESVPVPL
jgi:hypothetical protein